MNESGAAVGAAGARASGIDDPTPAGRRPRRARPAAGHGAAQGRRRAGRPQRAALDPGRTCTRRTSLRVRIGVGKPPERGPGRGPRAAPAAARRCASCSTWPSRRRPTRSSASRPTAWTPPCSGATRCRLTMRPSPDRRRRSDAALPARCRRSALRDRPCAALLGVAPTPPSRSPRRRRPWRRPRWRRSPSAPAPGGHGDRARCRASGRRPGLPGRDRRVATARGTPSGRGRRARRPGRASARPGRRCPSSGSARRSRPWGGACAVLHACAATPRPGAATAPAGRRRPGAGAAPAARTRCEAGGAGRRAPGRRRSTSTSCSPRWSATGYRREHQVEHRGEFAVRGGIVDVFPSTADVPVRIDLWGDEVDRLTAFDVGDQRSSRDLDAVALFGCRELVVHRRRCAPRGRALGRRRARGARAVGSGWPTASCSTAWSRGCPWLEPTPRLLPDLLPAGRSGRAGRAAAHPRPGRRAARRGGRARRDAGRPPGARRTARTRRFPACTSPSTRLLARRPRRRSPRCRPVPEGPRRPRSPVAALRARWRGDPARLAAVRRRAGRRGLRGDAVRRPRRPARRASSDALARRGRARAGASARRPAPPGA